MFAPGCLRPAFALTCIWLCLAFPAQASDTATTAALARLRAGEAVELIVEYDSELIERQSSVARRRQSLAVDDEAQLQRKAVGYRALKSRIDAESAHDEREDLADYSHLPMSFKRFRSQAALDALLARPEVRAVYANARLFAVTAQSLPLIAQPEVAAAGAGGSGATVAVLDTGINFADPAFGSCTTPGVPASCRVVAAVDFGSGGSDPGHGTNVAAIVAAVAPAARIAALNVFSGSGAYYADILEAINWVIANRVTYNFVAINMSLGDGVRHTTPCGFGYPFYQPIVNAANAGITVVVAAGNEAYVDGLASPACTPGAVSVGAVYDANIGGVTWGGGSCSDATTSADKVACFSNSASFLSMLAPGAMLTAGGSTKGGTSQAAPHVAGALAVLRSAYPTESPTQVLARLSSSGKPVSDVRNGLLKPRLDLLAAARPANDAFAARQALPGDNGSTAASTRLASRESGEPLHAANAGGRSLWWTLTPTAAGQLSLDSFGSSFDTLLAVYVGSTLATLTAQAANDNAGAGASAVLLQVGPGVPLMIAVDGADGEAGDLQLHWNLNASAHADLALGVSGPPAVEPGAAATWTVTVANGGPQAATRVVVTMTLPASASVVTLPLACSAVASTISCAAGTLAAGDSASFSIELLWAPDATGGSLVANAVSDLPDSLVANNAMTLGVVVAASGDNGDVPTLPEWAAIMLGALLLSQGREARRQRG